MLLQHENYGVGAGDQIFVWKVGVDCHIDRVQIAGVGAVAGKDGRGESALQRGKRKRALRSRRRMNRTKRLQSPQTPS